ncbi:MAG TPA: response regulator [Gemmatimonadales bacterium]|nr:response regulator [Gemmatimonadales bacterium]
MTANPAGPVEAGAAGPGPPADPAHILVIDDEEPVRGATVRLLQRLGYDAVGVEDGEAGLRYLRRRPAQLVITDMQMPGKSGLEVLLELRARDPQLPVIAMSGGDSSRQLDLLGSAGLLGAVAVVLKPYTVDELAAAVRGALATGPP